ncbi:MAG: ABC transporter ATP-binding protein [Nitrospirae bacterium]|nr:ABC transporter ATP-binding protein [Nitrospirota bacterium]
MKNDLKIILWFLRPYRVIVFLIFIFLFIYSILEATAIGSFYPVINSILSNNITNDHAGKLLNFLNLLSDLLPFKEKIISSCVFLIIMVILSNILGFFSESYAIFHRYGLHAKFLQDVYKRLINNHYLFFIESRHGDIIYVGMNASQSVGEMLLYFPRIGVEIFRIFAIIILMISISFKVTFTIFIIILIFGMIIHLLSNKLIHPIANSLQNTLSEITSVFTESMSGIRQIKIFNSMVTWINIYAHQLNLGKNLMIKNGVVNLIPNRLIQVLGVGSIVVSILYLKLFQSNQFTEFLPIIAVYVLSLQRLMPSIINIGNYWMGLKGLAPRLKITYEILNDKSFLINQGDVDFTGLQDEIEIKDISFSYPNRTNVIKNISLKIKVKETIAIVGESGSGKSTLADILVRLFEPQSGNILIDGIDYMRFNRSSYLNRIGMVTQDTFIFHSTIAENIKMGKLDAVDNEIINAAKIANAHDFVMELPLGYNTVVGDRGIKLSGGQRQRIAIARAIIRNPDILILDEATSALDNLSEGLVKAALKSAGVDRTNIIIAHRLSTVEHADRIYVIDNGTIVECGTHDELLQKNGLYSRQYLKEYNGAGKKN